MSRRTAASAAAAPALSGTQRAGLILLRAYVLFRLAGLLQVLIAITSMYPHYQPLAAGLGLIGAVVVESLLLIAVAVRRHRVPPVSLAVVDTVFLSVAMVGSALLASRTTESHTWVFFMYPFALLAVLDIALSTRSAAATLGMTGLLATVYAVSSVTIIGDPLWNAVPNAVPYLANSGVAWLVARALLRSGAELDLATATAANREVELARERERTRHARLLHDRVLQTMETLARGRWVADDGMRALVAADAAWLRSLVKGERPPEADGDLADGLEQLAARQALAGLRVQVHSAQLRSALRRRTPLPVELVDVVTGAVGETLTNVTKHAGVSEVVVHAELADGQLLISVLDGGCGFDPEKAPAGVGLARSVREPVEAVGGRVHVDSAPGNGTYVELRVPITAEPARDEAKPAPAGPAQVIPGPRG